MAEKNSSSETKSETISGKRGNVLQKLKNIIKEGNVRKVIVKGKNGKSIAEFPLTVGVIGTALVPVLAAVGAIVALASECSIVVEKKK